MARQRDDDIGSGRKEKGAKINKRSVVSSSSSLPVIVRLPENVGGVAAAVSSTRWMVALLPTCICRYYRPFHVLACGGGASSCSVINDHQRQRPSSPTRIPVAASTAASALGTSNFNYFIQLQSVCVLCFRSRVIVSHSATPPHEKDKYLRCKAKKVS